MKPGKRNRKGLDMYQTREKIQEVAHKCGFVNTILADNLEEAVSICTQKAEKAVTCCHKMDTQPFFHIDKGAADPFSPVVLKTVPDSQIGFPISSGHTDQCGDPHPEHGSRTTGYKSGCHTCNITGPHRCCKGGTDRLELCNSMVGPGSTCTFIALTFLSP